ncbi:hypothetical protein VTK73DRAFT_10160 [Phialemonium thermophilum]|uniref:Uncharacterized protein n=1 Tax=Phialemonium thermophilum TaxID=223376 RepID=A0ABR3VY66_9PEZI
MLDHLLSLRRRKHSRRKLQAGRGATDEASSSTPLSTNSDPQLRASPAPPRPSPVPPPSTSRSQSRSTRPADVDSLARELRKHDLRLDGSISHDSDFVPPPPPSPPAPQQSLHERQLDSPASPAEPRREPGYSPMAIEPDPAVVTDPVVTPETRVGDGEPAPDHDHYTNAPARHNDLGKSSSLQSLRSRIEDMISTGSQCNVYSAPLAPPPPSAAVPVTSSGEESCSGAAAAVATSREDGSDPTTSTAAAEPDFSFAAVELEVDEGFCGDGLDADVDAEAEAAAEIAWVQSLVSLRRAGEPSGIRKSGRESGGGGGLVVARTLLPFRQSADVALGCATVVRNRPRMRKRKRPGGTS